MKSPAYYRARIRFIEDRIHELTKEKIREKECKLLRNGVIWGEGSYQDEINQILHSEGLSDEPLTFEELSRYNTWFMMYPSKVCGREEVTSSKEFPVRIKGTKEDIIKAIRKTTQTIIKSPRHIKLAKIKAKAVQVKYHLQDTKEWYVGFQGLDGLDAIEELGALGEVTTDAINKNLSVVEKLLKDDRYYEPTDSLTFEEVVRLYNNGITEDEIRAWVWYQQGQGEKMQGWNKYYLRLAQDLKTTASVKSQSEMNGELAIVKDNHFRDIAHLQPGTYVGTATGKKHEYDKANYLIIKTDQNTGNGLPADALIYVKEKDVDLIVHNASINNEVLAGYVKAGILFYMNSYLLPYPIYAYGNMYDRELQLQSDKHRIISTYGQETYDRQYNLVVHSIDKGGVRPKMLSVLNPDPNQRPKILAISQFSRKFHVRFLKEETGIELTESKSLFEVFKEWLKSLDKTVFTNLSPYEIIKYYLDGDNLSKQLTEEEKSGIEKYGMLEAEALFTRFLYEAIEFDDQQKIDFAWNRMFNGHSAIPYNKVPVGFTCSAMFKTGVLRFSPAQREAIAFMEIARSGIIAYDVGVGKTMSAIITLANNLHSGKCQRPLIVVPNPTYAKWVREIIGYNDDKTKQFVPGVLSNTGYKVNEWYNLGVAIQNKIKLDKQVDAKTITVLTYEGFGKIGFSKQVFDTLFEDLSFILNQQDVANLTARDIEKRNQKYREMLGEGNKGTIVDIDKLGFDYIVIDEAHNYKNVFDNVLAGDDGVKRFKITGSQSGRAVKAFFHCNYIQRRFGRNVMLLTATPFTNSPLEIYSMLSLVAYNYMKQNGLSNVQRFMESFVLQTLEYVNSYDDTIREQHVVKSFNNRIVLQQLIFNHIAYKTGEDAGVKRPCKINLPRIHSRDSSGVIRRLEREKQVLTYLEMTPEQKANQEEIVELARSARPGDGNIMRALSQSLDNAVSPFLYKYSSPPEDYKEFVDQSPKLKYVAECIRTVKQWHEQRNEPVSGQVVYINRGKDYFKYIKEYLEKEIGFIQKVKFNKDTVDEVEIITSGMSLEKKETIKEAFLEGICKIIIGTASIREGIDLQKKGTVLYNCYPDWNPTDVKQLEGRIWRQGNEFGYVRVVMPLVQDSMDVFVFQKLEEKTSRINDLWYRGGSENVIDLESIDPEEVKFALFTNIDAIVNILIEKERREIRRKQVVVEGQLDTMSRFDIKLRKFLELRRRCKDTLSSFQKYYTDQFLSGGLEYIQKQWWKTKTKESQASFLSRVNTYVEQVNQFLSGAVQEDKEMLRLGRTFAQIQEEIEERKSEYSIFSDFKMYLSEVRKAEDTILKQKGYSIHDNMQDIIESIKKDKERIIAEYEELSTPEYYDKVYNDTKVKKDKLAVRGELPETRAKEFTDLNYLLSYRATDVSSDNCILPEIEKPQPIDDKARRLRLQKAKAKAFSIKLKMEK